MKRDDRDSPITKKLTSLCFEDNLVLQYVLFRFEDIRRLIARSRAQVSICQGRFKYKGRRSGIAFCCGGALEVIQKTSSHVLKIRRKQ